MLVLAVACGYDRPANLGPDGAGPADALSSDAVLTSFQFPLDRNPALSVEATARIDGTNITVTVPFATSVSALKATWSNPAASVSVDGSLQTRGVTANDFTNPLTYAVTTPDQTTNLYHVTVTVAPVTAPTFATDVDFSTGLPLAVALGNFNGDGRLDVATGSDPNAVALGDFNGDRKADLAVANTTDPGLVAVLLSR